MKASYSWIREYLPSYRGDAKTMADQLTFSGTEIERIAENGGDSILEAGVTSNRPDCLCHLGLAREVAAVSGAALVPPSCEAEARGRPTAEVASVTVEDASGCPRYTARVIEGVRVGPSPAWLQQRLQAIGLRPVNNVVDVTNFVMFELDQPLHAFDFDRLKGPAIVVRRARKGETLVALNGQSLALDAGDLVIADTGAPVAIAGVMGGRDSEVGDGTRRILLESAVFDPASVRRSSRRLQLASDSSYRFERGVDRASALRASERAAKLILELAGGTLLRDPIDAGGEGPAPRPIELRLSRIRAVTGVEIPAAKVEAMLGAVGCTVAGADGRLRVTPPSWRADLTREIDLVEEAIRLYGLEHVSLQTTMVARPVRVHRGRELRERLRERLVAFGYLETVTPDFVSETRWPSSGLVLQAAPLKVRNPVRAGEGLLRQGLLPSLLTVRKHNQDAGNEDLRLFELANLHGAGSADPIEVPVLGFLTDGDWRDARGVVEAIAEAEGLAIAMRETGSPALEPGTRAEIVCGERVLGYLGQPAKALLREAGLKVRPIYGELDLRVLLEQGRPAKSFRGLPKFPAAVRDLALKVDEGVGFGAIETEIRGLALADLEALSLFDIYRGPQVGEGKKSLAIRLVFRAADQTLTSESVDQRIASLVARLQSALGAEVRGA